MVNLDEIRLVVPVNVCLPVHVLFEAKIVLTGGASDAGIDVGNGGGGAGGYLASTATLSLLNTYTITVGGGGNGGAAVNLTSNPSLAL